MRYTPSRQYLTAGLVSAVLTVIFAAFAAEWSIALVGAVLFLLTSAAVLVLAFRPTIEVQENLLIVGRRAIPWSDVRRVDRANWILLPSPMVVYLTLAAGERLLIVYPGDLNASNSLLRHLRRNARHALIDGRPWREFWGEAVQAVEEQKQTAAARYQILRQDDEAEVERLYQLLKTVGHLDSRQTPDEK